jgi:hypothetical protein
MKTKILRGNVRDEEHPLLVRSKYWKSDFTHSSSQFASRSYAALGMTIHEAVLEFQPQGR